MTLQTEFDFVLPKGFIDEHGVLHQEGTMRMATAMDEIVPLRDPRVRNNEAYLVVVLLSQVITSLGTLQRVTPLIIESLFAADVVFLQDLYRKINDVDMQTTTAYCPQCGHEFDVDVPPLGE